MQQIKFFMVDAFTSHAFGGNAAAVCLLDEWLPDALLLQMAKQHNQSETAFLVADKTAFELRWFTTLGEINLCGHATLAAAHVIFSHSGYAGERVLFHTRYVGDLCVERNGDRLTLNFPAWSTEPVTPPALLTEALGVSSVTEVRVARDYMVILESADQVATLCPDINRLVPLNKMVCVTAPGDGEYDFVSRFFCPGEAVAEDPVTGSAHCMLAPWWGRVLGKNRLKARQISQRGGDLMCELMGDRVLISGQARTYLVGEIRL